MTEYRNTFIDGNELIEEAIEQYYRNSNKETLSAVLESIRNRMLADGHFFFPVQFDEDDETSFAFRTLTTKDGRIWTAAFTSYVEYEKGESTRVISNFIDSTMKLCLESEVDGIMINPWGRNFLLSKELIEMIFKANGDVEYHIPDEPITAELLEDGSFLKNAIAITNRNRTELNLIKLAEILRDSWVWIPCTARMSDQDYESMEKSVKAAQEGEGLDSLIGQSFITNYEVRMIPDILQSGDEYFFPVFTSAEEMGEYGDHFSKLQQHFLYAIKLALHNEMDVKGIVINAFSESFVIPKELFELISEMPSSMEGDDEDE